MEETLKNLRDEIPEIKGREAMETVLEIVNGFQLLVKLAIERKLRGENNGIDRANNLEEILLEIGTELTPDNEICVQGNMWGEKYTEWLPLRALWDEQAFFAEIAEEKRRKKEAAEARRKAAEEANSPAAIEARERAEIDRLLAKYGLEVATKPDAPAGFIQTGWTVGKVVKQDEGSTED